MKIRPATADDVNGIATVHVESWRHTYDGLIPADVIARFTVERRAAYWSRVLAGTSEDANHALYVAEDDENGEIIGFASFGPARDEIPGFDVELYAIYLLPAVQGRGVGQALTRAGARHLKDAGYGALLVWVLAGNQNARRFYEALGGDYVTDKMLTMGEAELHEVAYGWRDLAALAGPDN